MALFPGSVRFDMVLDGAVGTEFTLQNWCDRYKGTEITARIGGATAKSILDFPAQKCGDLQPGFCADAGGPVECPPIAASIRSVSSITAKTDLLPRCNAANLRMGLSASPTVPSYPAAAPGASAPGEWSGFEVTWTAAGRPVDCEFASAITIRLLDSDGNELDLSPYDFTEGRSIVVRFRRAKLPANNSGAVTQVHLPRSGGKGDYATETSLVSSAQGATYLWRNWCGEDRSPVTVEVTSAVARMTTVMERPSCVDPQAHTIFGTFDN
ncbi:MAG: hypothetical protein AB7J35_15590 [Dehalococcoidia bacterium]